MKFINLKPYLVGLVYRAIITEEKPLKLQPGRVKFRFEMRPRKLNVFLILLLFSPAFIFFIGVKGILEVWQSTARVECWSSYEITTNGEKPKPREMYIRF